MVVGLTGIGLVGSIGEYRDWKYQETFKYGQGVSDDAAKRVDVSLDGPYQSTKEKIRLRYPKGWDVVENTNEIVRFENPFAQIDVKLGKLEGNLPDIVRGASQGKQLLNDWEYVNGDRMGFTVITWQEEGKTHQKALGEKNGRLVIIGVVSETERWGNFKGVIVEVYKSVVLF